MAGFPKSIILIVRGQDFVLPFQVMFVHVLLILVQSMLVCYKGDIAWIIVHLNNGENATEASQLDWKGPTLLTHKIVYNIERTLGMPARIQGK